MALDWTYLAAAVTGGGLTKAVELAVGFWQARRKQGLDEKRLEMDAGASLRDDMREEIKRLLARVEGLETDVDQWRRSYWQVVEEREGLKHQNLALQATVESLQRELGLVEAANRGLERRIAELESRVPAPCERLTGEQDAGVQ